MPKKHPHPPLRDLLQQVQSDAEVWLPSRLQSGPKSWLVRGVEGLLALPRARGAAAKAQGGA